MAFSDVGPDDFHVFEGLVDNIFDALCGWLLHQVTLRHAPADKKQIRIRCEQLAVRRLTFHVFVK